MRVCWNRQTGTFEGRVSLTYGFKSRHSHQPYDLENGLDKRFSRFSFCSNVPVGLILGSYFEFYVDLPPSRSAITFTAETLATFTACAYVFNVVVVLLCPNKAETVLMSTPLVINNVANVCRKICNPLNGIFSRSQNLSNQV